MIEYPDKTRGVINQLLYPIDGAPNLGEEAVDMLVNYIIDGRLFIAGVEDFAAAIDDVIKIGALHPEAVEMSDRFSERELLEFLNRVIRKLEERRPWPPRLFTKLEVGRWASFGSTPVIAQINQPKYVLAGAFKHRFDAIPAGDSNILVLMLRLRSGEEVAIVGSDDPRSTTFSLLYRGTETPAEIVAYFRSLPGFTDSDVVPV